MANWPVGKKPRAPPSAALGASENLLAVSSGFNGSLLVEALGSGPTDQTGGPGLALLAVHRAGGLLPNPPCSAIDTPTPTATHTFPGPTETESPTGTPPEGTTPTPTTTQQAEVTPTPTSDMVVPTATATTTGTPGVDPELLMADINKDGVVDSKDLLILLKWWSQMYSSAR